jgi:hypothetical protein
MAGRETCRGIPGGRRPKAGRGRRAAAPGWSRRRAPCARRGGEDRAGRARCKKTTPLFLYYSKQAYTLACRFSRRLSNRPPHPCNRAARFAFTRTRPAFTQTRAPSTPRIASRKAPRPERMDSPANDARSRSASRNAGKSSSPPPRPALGFTRRRIGVFGFEPEGRGEIVCFRVRCKNAKGEPGPWGPLFRVAIP